MKPIPAWAFLKYPAQHQCAETYRGLFFSRCCYILCGMTGGVGVCVRVLYLRKFLGLINFGNFLSLPLSGSTLIWKEMLHNRSVDMLL